MTFSLALTETRFFGLVPCLATVPRSSAMTSLDKVPSPSASLDTVTRHSACLDTVPRPSAMPRPGASA